MSSWVVAVLVLNVALVVAVIVLALHIAGRRVLVAFEVELEWSPQAVPVSAPELDAHPRLPLFTPAQTMRAEWSALLDAFDAARNAYLRELTAWRTRELRTNGALTEAKHNFEIAKRRLTRFERE